MGKIVILGAALFVVVLSTSLAASCPSDQARPQGKVAKRLVGGWELISFVSQADPSGALHPTGLIYYDGTGHMAAQIMPDRLRPKYAGAEPTPDEAKAALTGYIAYF